MYSDIVPISESGVSLIPDIWTNCVEICNVCARKMTIKAAKRIINSDKMCHSYSDLTFGVTFLEHNVYHIHRNSIVTYQFQFLCGYVTVRSLPEPTVCVAVMRARVHGIIHSIWHISAVQRAALLIYDVLTSEVTSVDYCCVPAWTAFVACFAHIASTFASLSTLRVCFCCGPSFRPLRLFVCASHFLQSFMFTWLFAVSRHSANQCYTFCLDRRHVSQ